MSALIRLRDANRAFARRCQAAGWFAALFHVGVEKCHIEDAISEDRHFRRGVTETAHKAETYDLEALAKFDQARSPDSDGGTAITAREEKAIKGLILKSATLDHDASELAKVEGA